MTPEQYLESVMPTRLEVEAFTEPLRPSQLSRNGGVTYHPELGWLRGLAIRPDGVEGSRSFYSYGGDGARQLINCANQPCRLHTFGNSFTHCDQTNDGESWQEYLAAHLHEPVRNYGIGGFSVYQAYLRMKRVDTVHSVPYIILNVYGHDHYRNLFNWWAINFGQRVECGYTCPHLRVNVAANHVDERPNLLNRPENVYQLCDREWVIETFRDDPILPIALARRFPEHATVAAVARVAANFGIPVTQVDGLQPLDAINRLAQEAALFATQYVVHQANEFAVSTHKKLLILLMDCAPYVADCLSGRPRWDQRFVDFLRECEYPFLDLRDAYAAEHAHSKLDPTTFLSKYYHGHHTPAGNYFVAWAIKNHIVNWLDPKPAPYLAHGDDPLVHPDGHQKANQGWRSST